MRKKPEFWRKNPLFIIDAVALGANQEESAKMSERTARHRQKRTDWIFISMVMAAIVLVIAILCVYFTNFHSPNDNPGVHETTAPNTAPSDTVAPTLLGVHDFIIYQGDTISYYKGVSATDNEDPNPAITVDNSAVDLSAVGVYRVVYICKDAAGNETRAAATVTVLEKKANYAELETIYAAADAKLAQIIKDNMTLRQKVQAIYNWARANLGYTDNFDHSDYRQAAYIMLTQARGDCYGFFAVTKLMFERLGIPNIDVRKVKNSPSDSDHYWSLVSVDGEQTWYHFDATPRKGAGDDFCLVTDAFLDAYSDAHNKCHNRDKSLYPATP
ncbi:MAG: DUF5011 domain-containing protein [Ruminococcaceae bacterium]|nr:DUF5011 domain-containing protein [Oscillospiraceae bacterium]